MFSNLVSISHSGNITATISDHLPQFSFVPIVLSNPSIQSSNFMKEIGQNLNKETFVKTRIKFSQKCKIDPGPHCINQISFS